MLSLDRRGWAKNDAVGGKETEKAKTTQRETSDTGGKCQEGAGQGGLGIRKIRSALMRGALKRDVHSTCRRSSEILTTRSGVPGAREISQRVIEMRVRPSLHPHSPRARVCINEHCLCVFRAETGFAGTARLANSGPQIGFAWYACSQLGDSAAAE